MQNNEINNNRQPHTKQKKLATNRFRQFNNKKFKKETKTMKHTLTIFISTDFLYVAVTLFIPHLKQENTYIPLQIQ